MLAYGFGVTPNIAKWTTVQVGVILFLLTMHRLSKRECEILILAMQGHTDKETAKTLALSTGSVRTYWERMRRKYMATNRPEIVGKLLLQHLDTDLLSLLDRQRENVD